MKELNLYNSWISQKFLDEEIKSELLAISNDVDQIKDRFYKNLEFGTGGLRGIIGAGTNRMNIYTVCKATQGLANYIINNCETKKIAISYDTRINSKLFAEHSAVVMASNDIEVYLYKTCMPTPCLSFAVRYLNCASGIMITASHNPAKYNGYKVYDYKGCQLTDNDAKLVLNNIENVDIFNDVKILDSFENFLDMGKIKYIDNNVIDEYYSRVFEQTLNKEYYNDNKNLKVVFTPLNGTGYIPVSKILAKVNVTNLELVQDQKLPDGNFTTCPYPNPEIEDSLALGINICKKMSSDILIATDPDCDRLGMAVRDKEGNYKIITGNEIGMLLFNYICSLNIDYNSMPNCPIVIKTMVTTDIIEKIAENFNVEVINVLTGFKYIGEQIGILESKQQESRYLFGFEESYGFLSGTYVRDKDAVVASMLACEMAAYYKKQGFTLLDIIDQIFNKYGYFYNKQKCFDFEGEQGNIKMDQIMIHLRGCNDIKLMGQSISKVYDYKLGVYLDKNAKTECNLNTPKSNVIKYVLSDGSSIVIRPSGTEPKMKIYFSIKGKSISKCKIIYDRIYTEFINFLNL